jgi:hypothetical protein
MPRYLVKMERDGLTRYMEWSTIVDAPITYLLTLEEFTDYYREEYGRRAMEMEFEDRMKRVEATGISAHDGVRERDSLWKYNRAGEGETQLTEEQIWVKYHDERPKPEEQGPRPKRGDLWRHYKGTVYFVERVVKHSETGEDMVVYYRDGTPEDAWCRPLSMWHDEIEEGKRRFEPVTKR